MELSGKHLAVSSYLVPVYVMVILLSCLDMLGLATSVVSRNDTDHQALLEFKSKITGDQFGVMHLWNNSIHFCRWYGVTCGHKHQRVTKLELQSLKLVGSISPFIGNLSFLRVLNLQNNSFNHEVPQEIGRLRRLQILRLLNNSIGGEIPSNLSGCSELTLLSFGGNLLAGQIPGALGLLSKLKVFSLSKNNLRGTIPPSLGNFSSLEYMSLAYNRLSGVIPEALGQLKNLTYLAVFDNGISGTIPPSIFNLSNIKFLYFGINQIQGSLPSDLGITMPHIEWLDVGDNLITGPIPASISNASNLIELQFQQNTLSGNLTLFEKLNKLSGLRINDNLFGTRGGTDLNFLCSLTNATKLKYLDISRNNFGGMLPECISNLSSTLAFLIIQQNEISGRIPDGIGNLINLEVLAAMGNQISGSIPLVIGRLKKLKIFYAYYNSLSGAIPHSFGNLTMLTELGLGRNNLQGSIPSHLGRCKNLVRLVLSNNNLSGSIPPEVIALTSLSISLELSSNSLTGVLPVEVGNLINLGVLDVSLNRLSGVLPNNLGGCVRLEELYLEGNSFEGSIPSLSSLRGLKTLDISANNLSGEIPKFLVSFELLQYLNLSFNDFEGALPIEGVFKNTSATFIEGNKKLCGGTRDFHLPRCNLKRSKRRWSNALKSIIASVSGLLGLVLCFLFFFWFRRKKEQPTPIWVENSLLKLSYQSILKATDGFSSANLVGAGSFGSVYKGILEENGGLIAVKVLNVSNTRASRSFMAECEALKNIRHRNLVKILTACSGVDYQGNDFKALIYEFMGNGSLEDWLHPSVDRNEQEKMKTLNLFQSINVAVDIAHALEYLHHHCEASIVHCDLKPSNILLNDEMVGHVGDFGLAKFLSADRPIYSTSQSSSLGVRGTIGYAPPEYGLGSKVSTKGDVYSYGILLLEIFTGKRPTDEIFREGLSLHNFVKAALPERVAGILNPIFLGEIVKGGTITNDSYPENSLTNGRLLQHLNAIFEIGVTCSAESPTERMDMRDVAAKLCSIRDHLVST
ncbi:probable LRR receptor-like serine/threonine-protein kinase At3g47570 [Herrania umbratica]|uniref:non-specific serine/threonine protein kinase n=1 Tax=Herrania umbratica TaxID=108875 RepID=A0A6J1BAG6_9ROSI|nr:probable LRR receptor-like serine/threonine-protein kinase At3g47570 [Herrania umbratica]